MSNIRQQLLFLHSSHPGLDSRIIAWALYDGALPVGAKQMTPGDSDKPPYKSVLEAMQNGWFVIQAPTLPTWYVPGHEFETGHLPYEYVLERRVKIDE